MSAHVPAISVIMPVYNSRDYVARAVGSVLAQDLRDFELLLVDDGSTDGSADICDELAASDKRVRVLHIPNGGMCHARNLALDQARGTYVTFVDNDDECLPGFLGNNYALATINNADVVRFGRRRETYLEDGTPQETNEAAPREETVILADELVNRLEDLLLYGTEGVWTGLYKRELLNSAQIRFNEDLRGGCEDKIFNLDVYDHAKTMCLNPGIYYVWHRRASHSSSLSINLDYFLGYALYLHRLELFLADHEIFERNPDVCRVLKLAPFREMVGARCRAGQATLSQDKEFCACVRTVYKGYWTSALVDPKVPQSLVLAWVMAGCYMPAAAAVQAWRSRVQGRVGR